MADAFSETLSKLKIRLHDAAKRGLSNPETMQEIMMQLLGECEKNRQNALNQASVMEREVRKYQGQAEAFNSIGSLMFYLVDQTVKIDEREEEHARRYEEEQREKQEVLAAEQKAAFEAQQAKEAARETQEKPKRKTKQEE